MEPASVLINRLLVRGKFRHIQILLKLAELGSVQRAADAIGTTQSAVTQTLAYLEELLDIQLFQRHARGVTPTPACKDLIPVARNLMQGIHDGAECINAYQRKGQGLVRLVASASAVHALLIDALPRFHALMPEIQVQLREAEDIDQLLAISRREVDLVICRQPRSLPDGWHFSALLPDRLVVAGSARHHLADQLPDWADLAKETWVLAPAGSLAREKLDQISQHFPTPMLTYPLVTRSQTMLETLLLRHGCIALLPRSFVSHLIRAGTLCELPMPITLDVAPMGCLLPRENARDAAFKLANFLSLQVKG